MELKGLEINQAKGTFFNLQKNTYNLRNFDMWFPW